VNVLSEFDYIAIFNTYVPLGSESCCAPHHGIAWVNHPLNCNCAFPIVAHNLLEMIRTHLLDDELSILVYEPDWVDRRPYSGHAC